LVVSGKGSMNCLKCHKIKQSVDFYKNSRTCKVCTRNASAEWRSRNKTRDRARRQQYYADNCDRICAKSLARYYAKKDEILPKINRRALERRTDDPMVKLTHRIRVRMSKVIKGKVPADWLSILGYHPRLLVPHLEALFEPWMSWGNYGTEWHVDHKRPVSSFKLPEQLRECWALSNLQPLRSIDNLKKGARWSKNLDNKKSPLDSA